MMRRDQWSADDRQWQKLYLPVVATRAIWNAWCPDDGRLDAVIHTMLLYQHLPVPERQAAMGPSLGAALEAAHMAGRALEATDGLDYRLWAAWYAALAINYYTYAVCVQGAIYRRCLTYARHCAAQSRYFQQQSAAS